MSNGHQPKGPSTTPPKGWCPNPGGTGVLSPGDQVAKGKRPRKVRVAVTLDPELLELVDRYQVTLQRELPPGVQTSRSQAFGVLIYKGLEAAGEETP